MQLYECVKGLKKRPCLEPGGLLRRPWSRGIVLMETGPAQQRLQQDFPGPAAASRQNPAAPGRPLGGPTLWQFHSFHFSVSLINLFLYWIHPISVQISSVFPQFLNPLLTPRLGLAAAPPPAPLSRETRGNCPLAAPSPPAPCARCLALPSGMAPSLPSAVPSCPSCP